MNGVALGSILTVAILAVGYMALKFLRRGALVAMFMATGGVTLFVLDKYTGLSHISCGVIGLIVGCGIWLALRRFAS